MSTAVLFPSAIHAASCRRPLRRWDLAAVALVLAVQLVYFTGVIASDDFTYLDTAWHARTGRPMAGDSHDIFVRFVHWQLIHLAVAIFPHQPWAMVLPSLLASVAILLTLAAFARRYLDPAMAPLPVLIYGLVPVNVALATVALPDPLATAFGWFGVYLSAGALLERDTPRAGWRCLAGGLVIAVGYNAKETVAALVPGLILFGLVCRAHCPWAWRRIGLIAAGAGLWVAGETLAMACLKGDPWLHARAVVAAHEGFSSPQIEYTPTGLVRYWTEYLRWLADPRGDFAPMGLLLLAGLACAGFQRSPVSNLLICAVAPGLVYLSLGTAGIAHYLPLTHQPRYLVPMLPGLALLAAIMVWQVFKLGPRARRAVIFFGPLIILISLIAPNRLAGRWYQARTFAAGYRLLADYLPADEPGLRVCAAHASRCRFACVHRWLNCPELEVISPAPATAEEWIHRYAGAYILTTRSDSLQPSKKKHAHRCLAGRSYQILTRFERIARTEPLRDRLSTLRARLVGRPVPTDPAWAVELWRVPARR